MTDKDARMSKDRVRKGLSAYQREQTVLLRLLRKKGTLTAGEFDDLFRNREWHRPMRIHPIDGDSLLLGLARNGFNEWAWWLDLMQHMIAADLIDAITIDGGVVYSLRPRK